MKIDSKLMAEQQRTVIAAAILNLDEESFNFIARQVYQTIKASDGFKDKVGWLRLRTACEGYPPIVKKAKK